MSDQTSITGLSTAPTASSDASSPSLKDLGDLYHAYSAMQTCGKRLMAEGTDPQTDATYLKLKSTHDRIWREGWERMQPQLNANEAKHGAKAAGANSSGDNWASENK